LKFSKLNKQILSISKRIRRKLIKKGLKKILGKYSSINYKGIWLSWMIGIKKDLKIGKLI
jgi:hypothetical protein